MGLVRTRTNSLDAARAVRVEVLEDVLQLVLGPAHVGVAHAHLKKRRGVGRADNHGNDAR